MCICVFLRVCMYVLHNFMYVCVYVRKWLHMYVCNYVFIYIYIGYIYMSVCVFVFHFFMKKSLQPLASLSGLLSFTLSPIALYFHAYLVIQRREMKCGCTHELP